MRRELFSAVILLFFVFSLPATSQVTFYQPLNFQGCSSFVGDVNGDGKADLLCSSGALNFGKGDGTFTPGPTVSGTVLAVADFDGDGKPDVLEQGTGTLLVLLGNGDGTFQPAISTPSGAALSVTAAADVNGDGKADVVGVFNNALYVYIGNGDGTFKAGVPYNLGFTASWATLLNLNDFNLDGKLDAAVSTSDTSGAGQEIVFLGNGDGTFQATPGTSAGVALPTNDVAGDFNGDGKLDLVISTSPVCNGTCSSANVYFLAGNGDGTFQSPLTLFSLPSSGIFGPGSLPLAAADVNGDGKLDLVFSPDPTVGQIYLGHGDGTFFNPNSYVISLPSPVTSLPFAEIAIADFNLDGKLDIASANGILVGNGDGTFQGIPLGAGLRVNPPQQVSGKFENNGVADLAQVIGNQVNVLHNNGAGVLTLLHSYTLQKPGVSIVAADFGGDGKLDLAVAQQDPVTLDWSYSILMGNGDGSFQAPVFYAQNVASYSQSVYIYAADFNHDHKPDLMVTDVATQSLAVLLGNGNGTFASPVYYYNGGSAAAFIGDFNADGNLDIAGDALGAAGTGILYGNGDGTFQNEVFPASLSGVASLFTADFNNDGRADLLGIGSAGDQVALSNGDGTFTVLPVLPFSVAGVADFNGDGKVDLLGVVCCIAHAPSEAGVALGNGDGSFGSLINDPSTTNIANQNDMFVDMNGDGRLDIVFGWAGSFGGVNGLGVLFNTTSDFVISATVLTPSSLTPGSSATSVITSMANFGFNTAVALSCAGLPIGATCSFNPPSIANAAGTSQLAIATSSATAPGTYTVQVQGTAGSTVNRAAISLVVQATPDFSVTPAAGKPTSQSVSAGQSANFSLSLAGSGTFSGMVGLSCTVAPSVTLGPNCSLSSSSEQISGGTLQTVTVKIRTTAPSLGMLALMGRPAGSLPLRWMLLCTTILLTFSWLALRSRKRMPVLAGSVIVAFFLTSMACGGSGGSSSPHNLQGTPPGTYTATVTATSGTLNHAITLQVVVQ